MTTDLLSVNEQEFEVYQSFKRLYLAQHPFPVMKNEFSWKDAGFIFKGKVVTTIAAVLLAGFRTAEQFYLAASNQGSKILGWSEALLAVLAIEGLILFLAADRAKRRGQIHNWISTIGIILALIVSLLAGLGQSVRLINNLNQEILGWFSVALAIGLAFASFVAYIGGEIIGQELARIDLANDGNRKVYSTQVGKWEEGLNASWVRSQERKVVRVGLSTSLSESQKVSETYSDWRDVPHNERLKIAALTPKQIQKEYGVEERTSYHWSKLAEKHANEYVYSEKK